MLRRAVFFCLVCLIFQAVSCGVKAPPQPREVVVPVAVGDLSVQPDSGGVRVSFTLPSVSLDGSSLKRIGGYRVLREGPKGREVREEVRFSVTEQTRMVGKRVEIPDTSPAVPGEYRYCVIPLDTYGSHPRQHRWVVIDWEASPP